MGKGPAATWVFRSRVSSHRSERPILGGNPAVIEERPAGFERKRGLRSFPSLPTLMSCFSKILTLPGYVLDIQDIQAVWTVYSTPSALLGCGVVR